MLSSTGPGRSRLPPRHRLGTPGLVHCLVHPEVKLAVDIARCRHGRLAGLRAPVQRGWVGLRRHAVSLRHALSALRPI